MIGDALLAPAIPFAVVIALVACNGILGIPEVERLPGDAGGATAGEGGTVSGGCPFGQKSCAGRCVPTTSPATGCGAVSCEPCTIANGIATCENEACAVDTCSPGFGNCNLRPDDGCEQKVDTPSNCGSCDHRCRGGFVCTPAFECECTQTANCGVGAACMNGRCVCSGGSGEECFAGWYCGSVGLCQP